VETLANLLPDASWRRSLDEGLQGWEEATHPAGPEQCFEVADLPPFDLDANGFSRANAYWLSELSRLTYRSPEERAGTLRGGSVEEIACVREKGCHAALFDLGKRATRPCRVLSIRGTSNLLQWMLDFDFAQTEWSLMNQEREDEARVHRGFKRVFDLLWPPLENLLEQQTLPLVFTGHSLGAALANFTATVARALGTKPSANPSRGFRIIACFTVTTWWRRGPG